MLKRGMNLFLSLWLHLKSAFIFEILQVSLYLIFECCMIIFYGFSAVRLYVYVDLRCPDYDFSHWLYIIAYFDESHYCSNNPMHFLYLLPAVQINITAFISAIRVEDCRLVEHNLAHSRFSISQYLNQYKDTTYTIL